mmetsp:Transcript_10062/g.24903  ORF Transcript_10062/g.24903 Transcript_10062/m.24903 type:complete len:313 (+) Transcript_10062:98-1036(+)
MSTPRTSAKTRALAQLVRLRDASRDIFRNLHLTARTGKEEAERADMLASNRERLLTVLHQTQCELNKSVEELKQNTAHKERMVVLHKEIEAREAALRQYGQGLQKVESILCEGLRVTSNQGGAGEGRREVVEVEVDEVVRYAHLLSYTTSAKEGWEANTPIVGALPPMPHVGLLARSRLFPSNTKPGGAALGGMSVPSAPAEGGSKRPAEESWVRTWNPPKFVEEDEDGADADARPAKRHAGSSRDASGAEGEVAKPEPFVVRQMTVSVDEKEKGAAAGGDTDVHFVRATVIVPQKPAKWRPGDPIVVAPER